MGCKVLKVVPPVTRGEMRVIAGKGSDCKGFKGDGTQAGCCPPMTEKEREFAGDGVLGRVYFTYEKRGKNKSQAAPYGLPKWKREREWMRG